MLFLFLPSPKTQASTESGWVLEQKSKISGQHQIFISANRIKAVNNLSKISMFMQAPAWKIVILNDLSKTYYLTDIKNFGGENSGRVFAAHRDENSQGRWFYKGKSTVLNQKVDILYLSRQHVTGPQTRPGSVFEVANMTGVANATTWCMTDTKLSKPMAEFVSRIYCVSNKLHEFPVRVIYMDSEGATTLSLQTKSIKPMTITDSLFVIPKSYKQVKSEDLVYNDEQSKNSLKESFDWLGDVDKTKTKH
jgi:hypothetical protein